MKKYRIGVLALMAFGLTAGVASATPTLFEYAFNVDGALTSAGVDMSSFDTAIGLGTINFETSVVGSHSFLAFFDHEIDEPINTYFNESGAVNGTAASGQSWEIDEPGWVFGDIYDNFVAGTLGNDNNVPAGSEDDVSWAMGWNFDLAADETAYITLTLSSTLPVSGFYLTQFDPDSQESIYFFSNLEIRGDGGGTDPVPEPATMLLMGTGLAGLLGVGRKKMKKA